MVDGKRSSAKSKATAYRKPVNRKEEALRRLDVDLQELESYPSISEQLKEVFGTVEKAIAALRFSNTDTARTFFECYDGIPSGDRKVIPIEAIALKSGTGIVELYGAILLGATSERRQRAAMVAVNAYPEIMNKTVKFAKEAGGHRDRSTLHNMIGFLPSPKGGGNMSVNIVNGIPQFGANQASSPEAATEDDGEEDDDFLDTFPPIQRELEAWSEGRRKVLGEDA